MIEVITYPEYEKSDPRFYPSQNKKPGSPLIFFVHFYGGHQKVLKRHITMVNELGYDAFAFNMPQFKNNIWALWRKRNFGMKHFYSNMISFYLNQIPGQKIIYAFSNPSASAIESIAKRMKHQQDVIGLVCDSGPSQHFLTSAYNLAIPVQKNPALLFLFSFFWSCRIHFDLPFHLKRLPAGFPVLSIRGEKDVVIPPWHIEDAFKNAPQLDVTVMSLAGAGHLDGLKNFPEEYRAGFSKWVARF